MRTTPPCQRAQKSWHVCLLLQVQILHCYYILGSHLALFTDLSLDAIAISSNYQQYVALSSTGAPDYVLLELQGAEVVAKGWYRRAPTPYVELLALQTSGTTRTCYVYYVKLLVSVVLVVAGLLAMAKIH